MRPWVSCDDKLDLLDRMYAVAHSNLGKKDQTVYIAMRQEYIQRIEAVKALKKRTTEAGGKGKLPPEQEPASEAEETAPEPRKPEPKPSESADLGPADVVRLFVSCWDCQDFMTEFSLLSPTFLRAEGAPSDLKEYVRHRKAKYSARLLKGQMGKSLESICGSRIEGSQAVVDCVEARQWHTSTAAERRRYHLRHYPEGWLIDYFENVLK
jgi:hypothetical protein